MHTELSSATRMLVSLYEVCAILTVTFNKHEAYQPLDINESSSQGRHNRLMLRLFEISNRRAGRLLCNHSFLSLLRDDARGPTQLDYGRAMEHAQKMSTLKRRKLLR